MLYTGPSANPACRTCCFGLGRRTTTWVSMNPKPKSIRSIVLFFFFTSSWFFSCILHDEFSFLAIPDPAQPEERPSTTHTIQQSPSFLVFPPFLAFLFLHRSLSVSRTHYARTHAHARFFFFFFFFGYIHVHLFFLSFFFAKQRIECLQLHVTVGYLHVTPVPLCSDKA